MLRIDKGGNPRWLDLMDGDQLADKLKEMRLGIRTEMAESKAVDADWFKSV